jgi:hypothetical protein
MCYKKLRHGKQTIYQKAADRDTDNTFDALSKTQSLSVPQLAQPMNGALSL